MLARERGRTLVQLTRRRRANVPGGRLKSHVVRVSEREEAQLLVMAKGEVTIPRLLVETTLASGGETPTEMRADYRVVDRVSERGAEAATAASFVVEDGDPALHRA